ncbi:MAG: hypothetical protein Q8M66_04820 [Actinomycetota bacterium]|nr:hypothetical protein [Actinomycetota bacterium]MDZ4180651.1 hypothetical protein [Coriobacteriia bacterium]
MEQPNGYRATGNRDDVEAANRGVRTDDLGERAAEEATARYAAAEHELRQARFEQAIRRASPQN